MYEFLLALILAFPLVTDSKGHPIRRPLAVAQAIAAACNDRLCARTLDVLAGRESGYREKAVGDSGRSCGIFQTPCRITPKDAAGQAKLARELVERSYRACPEFPLSTYATGRCQGGVRIVDAYLAQIRAGLAE